MVLHVRRRRKGGCARPHDFPRYLEMSREKVRKEGERGGTKIHFGAKSYACALFGAHLWGQDQMGVLGKGEAKRGARLQIWPHHRGLIDFSAPPAYTREKVSEMGYMIDARHPPATHVDQMGLVQRWIAGRVLPSHISPSKSPYYFGSTLFWKKPNNPAAHF